MRRPSSLTRRARGRNGGAVGTCPASCRATPWPTRRWPVPSSPSPPPRNPAAQLLRYLLFSGEAPLGGQDPRKVLASSEFAREFAARGLRDSKKRSLRDFDLRDRIFTYPCSYLIYSSAFDAIPEPAKGYI